MASLIVFMHAAAATTVHMLLLVLFNICMLPPLLFTVIHAAAAATVFCLTLCFVHGHLVVVVCLSCLPFSGPSGLTSAGAWHSLPQLHVPSVLFHVSVYVLGMS